MVLFTIACDTCASRLNVKQQAAIGQVLACPKCGSMVHVEPPEGWVSPVETAPPKKPRAPRDPNDSQATLSGEFSNLADRDSARRPLSAGRKKTATKLSNANPSPTPPVQETIDVANTNHWQADGSSQRGKGLAWVAGIIGICLVAFVLVLFMVSRMMGRGEDIAQTTTNQDNSVEKTKSIEDNVSIENEPPNPPAVIDDKAEKGNAGSDSGNDANVENDTDTGATDNGTGSSDVTNANPDDNSQPVIDENAALNPSGDNLTMQQDVDRPSMLDEFEEIGDLVFNPGVDMDEVREVAGDDQTHKYGIGNVFVPVPRKLAVDGPAATSEVYLQLAFKDQTLIEFARNLFSLSQVPVQLDSNAIVTGRLNPLSKINAEGTDVTLKQILEMALTPLNLSWRWNDDSTILEITPNPSDAIVATEIPLDTAFAITDVESTDRLINGIQLVVEPGSWNNQGGVGSIKIENDMLSLEQTADITKRVNNLLSRLAVAAKLKSNPADEPLVQQIATVYSNSRDIRETEGVVNSIQLLPIQKLLNELGQQDGITIIVNWDELSREDWNPNTRIPWNSNGKTIEETLHAITNSMGLAYRMLDENTLEITSKHKFWTETRLEIYPCSQQLNKNFTGDQIMQFIEEGILADLPKQTNTPVLFSSHYNCIVAVLPDPLHIRVEKILQQLADRNQD